MKAKKNKKIFIGTTTAGAQGVYAFTRVLKKEGTNITFWSLAFKPKFSFSYDKVIPYKKNIYIALTIRVFYFITALFKYDVFHFYARAFFIHPYFDLVLLKIFRKKIVYTYAGSDGFDKISSVSKFGEKSPYYEYLKKASPSEEIKRRRFISMIRKFADKIILNGPWLIDSVKKYNEIIPYSRDINELSAMPRVTTEKGFKIIHAPTNEEIKGTKYIKKALNKITKKYPFVLFKVLKDINHSELLKECRTADLAIDQLLIGWYGGFAVEMMAMGVPVVAYINEEYLTQMNWEKSPPLINANTDNLYEIIEWSIRNKKKLHQLSNTSKIFVKNYHSPDVIANKYKRIYDSIKV